MHRLVTKSRVVLLVVLLALLLIWRIVIPMPLGLGLCLRAYSLCLVGLRAASPASLSPNTLAFGDHLGRFDSGVILAQTPSQLKLQLLSLSRDRNQYSLSDVELIMFALNRQKRFVAKQTRMNGRWTSSHLIGTASCSLRVGLPPAVVAAAIVHTLYIQDWQAELQRPALEDICAQRAIVRQEVGDITEPIIWRFSVLFSQGIAPEAVEFYLEGLQWNVFSDEEKAILGIVVCDELDEHFGGEQWWINWKQRDHEYESSIFRLTEALRNPALKELASVAFRWTHTAAAIGTSIPEVAEGLEFMRNASSKLYETATDFTMSTWLVDSNHVMLRNSTWVQHWSENTPRLLNRCCSEATPHFCHV